MSLWEIFFIGVGLSMDAMAASVCKGLAAQRVTFLHCAVTGLYFGLFQAAMPLIGYLLGQTFSNQIASIDHWIAFVLLAIIGAKMLYDSRSEQPTADASFSPRTMLPLALATSIDALAVGVSFAFLQVNILSAICLIGCVTFVLSALGVRLGSVIGARFHTRAEQLGGIILILMGVKILIEHLTC